MFLYTRVCSSKTILCVGFGAFEKIVYHRFPTPIRANFL